MHRLVSTLDLIAILPAITSPQAVLLPPASFEQSHQQIPASPLAPYGTWECYNPDSLYTCQVPYLMDADFVSESDGWLVGWDGALAHWDGIRWTTVPSPATDRITALDMLTASDAWAVGWYGTVLHWDGQVWTDQSFPTVFDLNSVSMLSAAEGWAVGTVGTLLHYTATDFESFLPLIRK
jgi:hypothetical protein